jgi:hypothetical protein
VFDDVELTAAEVARLAAEARPLVRSRGRWIALDRADLKEAAAALAEAARSMPEDKPLLAVFLTEEGAPAALRDGAGAVPCFAFPEDAAMALARAADRAAWLRRPSAEAPPLEPQPDREGGAAVLAAALGRGDGWLSAESVNALAASYGLPLVEPIAAASVTEAVRIAAAAGGPVALKAVAAGLVHKTDTGGVATGLRGSAAIRRAAKRMRADVAAAGFRLTGYLVQPMVPHGVELHVGASGDGLLGPLLACAAGGVAAELIEDVSLRLVPLEEADPAAMVRELATFPLLDRYRGAPAADVVALEDVIRRVSALATDHPAIAELDCNPVVVGPGGASIVDMRVRVSAEQRMPPALPGTLPASVA